MRDAEQVIIKYKFKDVDGFWKQNQVTKLYVLNSDDPWAEAESMFLKENKGCVVISLTLTE